MADRTDPIEEAARAADSRAPSFRDELRAALERRGGRYLGQVSDELDEELDAPFLAFDGQPSTPVSREEALRQKARSLGVQYEEDAPMDEATSAPLLTFGRPTPALGDESMGDPIDWARQDLIERALRAWDNPQGEPLDEDLDAPILELRRTTPASDDGWSLDSIPDVYAPGVRSRRRMADRRHQ